LTDRAASQARLVAVTLVAAAVALGATALATSPLAAFIASPLTLALAAQALRARSTDRARLPSRLVGLGLPTVGFGLGLWAAGPAGGGLLTTALGLALTLLGVRLSLDRTSAADPGSPSARPPALEIAVAADLAVQAAWELGGRLRQGRDWDRVAAEVRELAERNERRGWIDRPERAHPLPPPLEKPRLLPRHLPGVGRFAELRFESEFDPSELEVRTAYLNLARNREGLAYLWRHRDGPRPTLLCVHGFGMGRVALDVWRWDVAWLHRRLGVDVALAILPLHGPRSELGPSGLRFFDVHPAWTAAALGHSIWDLRRLAGWLRAQGVPALGVHGLSLGGHLAALYGSLDPDLAAVVPMIPAVALAELWWEQLPGRERRMAEAAGLTLGVLEQAWAPHAPLRHRPRAPFAGRLIVAASADRLIPREQPRALWEHWGRPALHWFPGTHQVWIGRRDVRMRLDAHLRATLLASHPPAPPLSRFRV
jgi:hypothetical protein